MGKLLIRLGQWMSRMWCKLMCLWNALLLKLTISVEYCPNQLCKCKNKM